jgi:cytochrome c556
MTKATKGLAIAVLVASVGMAFAMEGSVGVVKERQDLMGSNGGAMKVLGDMAKGGAFDAAAAQAALETLKANAAMIPKVFEANDLTQPTKAKPEIWADYAAFTAAAMAMETAAGAVLAAPVDAAALGAAMQAIGGTCQGCHMAFRLQ